MAPFCLNLHTHMSNLLSSRCPFGCGFPGYSPVAAVSRAVFRVTCCHSRVLSPFCGCRVRPRVRAANPGWTLLAGMLAPELFADWFPLAGAPLHHRGVSPLFDFDSCSTASCLAVPRPRKVTHLKPQSMQNITLLPPPPLQKKKKSALLFSPLPLMSTSSQSFDCMSQLKHLMLYLNLADLEEPLSSVRDVPSA